MAKFAKVPQQWPDHPKAEAADAEEQKEEAESEAADKEG